MPASGAQWGHSGHDPHLDTAPCPAATQLHSRLIEIEKQMVDLELQLARLRIEKDGVLDAIIHPIPGPRSFHPLKRPLSAPIKSKDTARPTYPGLYEPLSPCPSPPSPSMQSTDTTGPTYPINLCFSPSPSPPPPTQSKATTGLSAPEIQAQRRTTPRLPPSRTPSPPMPSKSTTRLTASEIQIQRMAERNEKARLRMARKRAELKTRPWEEQQQALASRRATHRRGVAPHSLPFSSSSRLPTAYAIAGSARWRARRTKRPGTSARAREGDYSGDDLPHVTVADDSSSATRDYHAAVYFAYLAILSYNFVLPNIFWPLVSSPGAVTKTTERNKEKISEILVRDMIPNNSFNASRALELALHHPEHRRRASNLSIYRVPCHRQPPQVPREPCERGGVDSPIDATHLLVTPEELSAHHVLPKIPV
ncbi:hypothetical protein FB451DRAFT_1529106 [Mycena latifolia]|nr:hypothetical protein FB451DRAFT_1529106 [Mycena latifolia]